MPSQQVCWWASSSEGNQGVNLGDALLELGSLNLSRCEWSHSYHHSIAELTCQTSGVQAAMLVSEGPRYPDFDTAFLRNRWQDNNSPYISLRLRVASLIYDIGHLGKRHFVGFDLWSPMSKYFKASGPVILK